jgi:hypothetical protein
VLNFRIAVVFLLVAMLAVPLAQAQAGRAQAEATIRQLEQDIATATERGDWRLWDQVVAPDWTFIDSFGRVQDKPAVLANYKKLRVPIDSTKLYGVQVKFLKDDVAVVMAQASAVGGPAGRKIKIRFSYMDVFVQRQGKWVIVASEATPIKEAVN